MPFVWITDVGVGDIVEGDPTGYGDIRELRVKTDYIWLNMCGTYYVDVLSGDDNDENSSEDIGDKTTHTCSDDKLDNNDCPGNLGTNNYPEDVGEDTAAVNDQTNDFDTECITIEGAAKGTAQQTANLHV